MTLTLPSQKHLQAFVIEGGQPLGGSVRASGNKNGVLPVLAACVLASEPVQLTNVPRIRDVTTMLALLDDIGAEVEWTGPNEVRVDSSSVHKSELDEELCRRIRASFLLAGPLLSRFGRASVPPPGGDVIGRRRLDPHMHALRRARGRDLPERPLRDADERSPRQARLPGRAQRHGDGERGHGGCPRAKARP